MAATEMDVLTSQVDFLFQKPAPLPCITINYAFGRFYLNYMFIRLIDYRYIVCLSVGWSVCLKTYAATRDWQNDGLIYACNDADQMLITHY